MNADSFFSELSALFNQMRLNRDPEKFLPRTFLSEYILSCYETRNSLPEAFFLALKKFNVSLGKFIFGSLSSEISFDSKTQVIFVSDSKHKLQIILNLADRPFDLALGSTSNSVVLYTDFNIFEFWNIDDGAASLFFRLSLKQLIDEVSFSGSIWSIVFPSYFGIITRTISYTFPQDVNSAFFSANLGLTDSNLYEEREMRRRLEYFDTLLTQVKNLHEFYSELKDLSNGPKLLSENKSGEYMLRHYSPSRSDLFDYEEPVSEMKRGDFVSTYSINDEEFHREFFLSPRGWDVFERELKLAAFDILHMLSIRRTKLFRSNFASRVYNILLPPIVILEEIDETSGYTIFPCVNLYRTTLDGYRKTLSVTYVMCPVKVLAGNNCPPKITSRKVPIEEFHKVKSNILTTLVTPANLVKMKKFKISGPGKEYSKLNDVSSLPEMLMQISRTVLHRIIPPKYENDPIHYQTIESNLVTSNLESRIATLSLQVEWQPLENYSHPWEKWLKSWKDEVLCNNLFRLFFYQDFIDPQSASVSINTVNFKDFNISNTIGGVDIMGITLYNPQEDLKMVLYPRRFESYPNYSIIRWMAWNVYIDSALTSLRALIYKFNPVFESRRDLHSIINTLDEMVQEFVEFYDLDLRDFDYRKEYENIRKLMQIDLDYELLISKFETRKEKASLREQRLINKLIVSLTVVTVTLTVVSTLAQLGFLGVSTYLITSFVLSTFMVWLGYAVFDPIRWFIEVAQSLIKKIRR